MRAFSAEGFRGSPVGCAGNRVGYVPLLGDRLKQVWTNKRYGRWWAAGSSPRERASPDGRRCGKSDRLKDRIRQTTAREQ